MNKGACTAETVLPQSPIRLSPPAVCLAACVALFCGCADEPSAYPSPEGKPTPYILKQGCTFSIVEELSRASLSSPEVSGAQIASSSASISLGAKSITVSDCRVSANSHSLPVYEE